MEITSIEQQVGMAVKKLRKGLGLTQQELAIRADLHRTYVSDVERGRRNVSLQCIKRLASALNAPIATLFLESKDSTDEPSNV